MQTLNPTNPAIPKIMVQTNNPINLSSKIKFGIIGSGSWATALAKILTDNNNTINWWIRNEESIKHILNRHHNPHYLSSAYFDTALLHLTNEVAEVIKNSDCIIFAVPSAYADNV